MYKNFDFKIKDLFFSSSFEDEFLLDLNFSFLKAKTTTVFAKSFDFKPFNILFDSLNEYLKGEPITFKNVKIKLLKGSIFKNKVYENLIKVPFGKTVSYKELCINSGLGKAYQGVGQALGANPIPIIIPCHRVLKSDGTLGGYNGGLDLKKYLLSLEKSKFLIK